MAEDDRTWPEKVLVTSAKAEKAWWRICDGGQSCDEMYLKLDKMTINSAIK